MIVTLTPNPALDLTYHLPHLDLGASQRVPPAEVRAGGKGINVARVLHAQGRDTHVVAPVGGSTGETLRTDLEAAALPHALLDVGATTRRTLALVTPTETTNLNESGAPLTAAEWTELLTLTSAALTPDPQRAQECPQGAAGHAPRSFLRPVEGHGAVLVCSGSLPAQAPADVMARVVGVAREHGARCVIDTSGDHLLAAADAGADVLKPNHHELLAVMGGSDVLAAARGLAERSGGLVYASLGSAGLLRVPHEGPVLHAHLKRTITGNTTGAGDAAVAAIAASIAAEAAPEDTLRLAIAWSAAAVLHPLAGSITDPEPLLPAVEIAAVTTAPALKD